MERDGGQRERERENKCLCVCVCARAFAHTLLEATVDRVCNFFFSWLK